MPVELGHGCPLAERLPARRKAARPVDGTQPTGLMAERMTTAAVLVLGERLTPTRRHAIGARTEAARGRNRSRVMRRDAG